jgi:photosystem II stability/assembly factor-like uncharacterized protein
LSKNEVLLAVGTAKGAFVFTSDRSRREWKAKGPFFSDDSGFLTGVYHLAVDRRDGNRIYAGVNTGISGPHVSYSDDLGETWKKGKKPPRFPKKSGLAAKNIWHIASGREDEPEVMFLGMDPHALFRSEDRGETWDLVEPLTYHAHRNQWNPGAGGPCLHTIVLDPRSKNGMWVGMSAAGVYHTSDMKSWKATNKGIRVDFAPKKYPEFGQCVHKFALGADGRTLYLQNHGGVYRSDDHGQTWHDIGKGLPSDFGFALATHPSDPKTFYIAPLEIPARFSPGGQFAVYSTDDSGKSWEALTKGLPNPAYLNVLREGICTDGLDPAGIYVGTRSGTIFYSRDEGRSWGILAQNLPQVLSVSSG